MGYYCDITVRCREGIYQELKALWGQDNFPKPSELIRSEEEYIIQWFSCKWSSAFLSGEKSPEEVITALLKKYDESYIVDHPEYKFGYCVIGEELSDITCISNSPDMFLDVSRDVVLPFSGDHLDVIS